MLESPAYQLALQTAEGFSNVTSRVTSKDLLPWWTARTPEQKRKQLIAFSHMRRQWLVGVVVHIDEVAPSTWRVDLVDEFGWIKRVKFIQMVRRGAH